MTDNIPSRQVESGIGWSFGILAAVILMIIISWGFGSHGRRLGPR